MTATPTEVVHAYRNLYRGLLRAVLYSSPARYVARDRLRKTFRNDTIEDFDHAKIARTLQLLEAARNRGTAHKLVKNILRVWGEHARAHPVPVVIAPVLRTSHDHFNRTIAKLNETMGLCIK